MGKNEVSRQLGQIAACLELKGENTFRVRAYQTAARAVAGFPDNLASAATTGELTEIKGIGPATLKIIVEILATGKSEMLESLRREIPAGLVDMMQISGLGVTKIRQIHEGLGLDTLSELEAAARDGRLAGLPPEPSKRLWSMPSLSAFARLCRPAAGSGAMPPSAWESSARRRIPR